MSEFEFTLLPHERRSLLEQMMISREGMRKFFCGQTAPKWWSSGEKRQGELTSESCLQAVTSARNGDGRRKRGAQQDQNEAL